MVYRGAVPTRPSPTRTLGRVGTARIGTDRVCVEFTARAPLPTLRSSRDSFGTTRHRETRRVRQHKRTGACFERCQQGMNFTAVCGQLICHMKWLCAFVETRDDPKSFQLFKAH